MSSMYIRPHRSEALITLNTLKTLIPSYRWFPVNELSTCLYNTFIHSSDFNLSGGCFGTEIIKKCTKWSNIGVHGLRLGPIEAEFQGASFSIRKNAEKKIIWSQKTQKWCFSWTKFFEKQNASHQICKKWKLDIIYLNSIEFNYLW